MLSRAFSFSGTSIHGIASHRLQRVVVFYSAFLSTSAVEDIGRPLMVDYLVKSLGFSEESATSIAKKVRPVKSCHKSQKVVDFLTSNGFDQIQIRKLVKSCPSLLFNNVDKTLSPKIKVFQEFGLSRSEIGAAITANPRVLERSVKAHVVPVLEFFKSFATSHGNLVKFFLNRTQPFSFSLDLLRANVCFLLNCGVPKKTIERLLLKRYTFLFRSHKWLHTTVEWVEAKLGMDRRSPRLVSLLLILGSVSNESMMSKLGVFRDFGWTEMDLSLLIRRFPNVLGYSESSIRAKLEFLMGEMSYTPAYLISYSYLLSYSLEKRVKPRNQVLKILKERQLLKPNTNLFPLLIPNEPDFLKKYLFPFKDKVPGLYDDYVYMTGSILKL